MDVLIDAAQHRIWRLILGAGVLLMLGAAVAGGWRTALGAGIGVGLSGVNYAWLKAGVDSLSPDAGASANAALVRFAARQILVCGALCAMFISHLVPLPAVAAGLFAAPAGVLAAAVVEAAHQLQGRSEL